jgi:hypothetical protein
MKRNQRGIALIMALFALLLLTGIGLGLLYMTDAETAINRNYRTSQQAYFAAMAGLQNVRERMTPANVAPHLIVGPLVAPGNNNSILYVVNPAQGEAVDPTSQNNNPYIDNQLCTEYPAASGHGCPVPTSNYMGFVNDDTPGLAGTVGALPYKWVRVEQKMNASLPSLYRNSGSTVADTMPICWNGANELPLSSFPGDPSCSQGAGSDPPGHTPVYLLTAFATTSTGASRVLQMEVAQDPPLTTHGAVDSQDHVNLNGQLTVNGYDYCSCTCTTTGSGSNQTTTCTNRTTGAIAPTCDGTHYSIYSASTVQNPNNSETLVAGTNPPVVQNQPWTWDVNELVQKYSTAPGAINVTNSPYNWSCSASSCGTQASATLGVPPTFPPNPPINPVGPNNMQSQITIVPGNLQLTGGSVGNGILVVNGNLDIHGGLNFYGVIIVTGVISFTGGGSSATNIYGAVIAGQQSYVDNTLGGSANINFDFCALPGGSRTQPPRSLAMRDINF